MAEPHEKLAASLDQLRALQEGGRRVFQSKELGRVHRERLLKQSFIREIMKGWLISSSPNAAPSDSSPWFASFWEFCVRYCNQRFGDAWYLSPEQSLLLHAENRAIPKQVIVYSPKGTNNNVNLLFGTSIFDLKQKKALSKADVVLRDDLRLCSPPAALIKVPEPFYNRFPVEAQVVLAGIRESSDVLRYLLEGGHSVVSGRLAGALRRVGRDEMADEIVAAMRSAGYDVRESDPFEPDRKIDIISRPPFSDRRPFRGDVALASEDGAGLFPRDSWTSRKTRRVFTIHRRHLSKRRIPLALDRGISSDARAH